MVDVVDVFDAFEAKRKRAAKPIFAVERWAIGGGYYARDCCFPVEYVRIALDPVYNQYIARLRRKAKVTDLA
jgi:hypothetical protein